MHRGGRLLLSSLLALAPAAGAAAAVVVHAVPEAALAPLGVPAVILGDPANMPAALAEALQSQGSLLPFLPAPRAASYLIALAASEAPVERAAAKLLARFLVEPPGAPAAAEPGLRRLADAAKNDPAFAQWSFDGKPAARPSLELDGLAWEPGSGDWNAGEWKVGDKSLERIDRGGFGFVDEHPAIAGAVLKTVARGSAVVASFDAPSTPAQTASREEETAHLLAAAGAGPRHFGRAEVAGQLVSVRERIYGDTLAKLFLDRRHYGLAEHELVMGLLRRMAAAGIATDDLRPPNIMIGRTLFDPRRRAYVIDGGSPVAFPAGLDEAARLQFVLAHYKMTP